MTDRKKRILFVGEASFLYTGFSTYYSEVIKRLYEMNLFEVGEIGCYAADGDARIKSVPWKFYPVMPHPNDQVGQQRYRSDQINQFGKFIFDDVCLDFKPDIVCVPPWTKIATTLGIKDIQDIQIGEEVISHTGEPKKVLKTFKNQYIGNIVKIKIGTDSREHTFTENHPILIIKKVKRYSKGRKVTERHFIKDAKFIPAKDIGTGDYVLIPKTLSNNKYDVIKISSHLHQFILSDDKTLIKPCGRPNAKYINNDININNNLAKLFGYYCAEGHTDRHGVHFTFGHNDQEKQFVNDVENLLKNIFNIDCTIAEDGSRTRIRADCVILGAFFEKFAGNGAFNKCVPYFIFDNNNENIIKNFIKGLIRGDGCYNGSDITYSSVSEQLAMQLRNLLFRLNIKNSIYKNPPRIYVRKSDGQTRNNSEIFMISITSEYAQQLHSVVQKEIVLPKKLLEFNSDGLGWFEDNYFIARVKTIHKNCYYEGQVYNLEVADNNSYVTGFAVHNCDIRDEWMVSWIDNSPFRNMFKFIHMACCDGSPQRVIWIDSMSRRDKILTYSDFGQRILSKEGGGKIPLGCIASPGSDPDIFKPPDDKRLHKTRMGMDPNTIIIGTINRNQKRKLFYDLIEAFSLWVYKAKTKGHLDLVKKTFLYLHTSYPDVGYDIGRAITEFKVGNKVLLTYMCNNCGVVYPSFFQGEWTNCRRCKQKTAHPPNANSSPSREVLANIMKCFDLYVNYSICEGFSMGCRDANTCGLPLAAVRYSAMEDHIAVPGNIPIEVGRFFYESIIETEQRRALPDNNDFINKLDHFVKLSEEKREEISKKIRIYAIEPAEVYGQSEKLPRFSWDRTAAIWKNVLNECKVNDQNETWLNPNPKLIQLNNLSCPNNLDNAEFVNWVIENIYQRPELCNSYFAMEWIRWLNLGFQIQGHQQIKIDRQYVANYFTGLINKQNAAEMKRIKILNKHNNPEALEIGVF